MFWLRELWGRQIREQGQGRIFSVAYLAQRGQRAIEIYLELVQSH